MSQPPSARPSPTGSPAVRPNPSINLENIYSNLAALIQRLRSLIGSYAKDIIIFHARLGRPNPLLSLPELLNPTMKVGNYEPLTTEAAFLGSIQQGIQAARSIKPDQALIASVAARNRQQVRPPAAGSPANSARASPQPQAQQPAMSLNQVKELIALPTEERNRRLDADPPLKARFVAAYQYFQRRTAAQKAGGPVRPPAAGASTATSAAGTPAGSPAPATAGPATAAGTPNASSAPATPTLPAPVARPPPSVPPATAPPAVPSVPTIPTPTPPPPKPASPAPPPARPTPPSQPTTPATPTLPPQPPHAAPVPVQAPPPPVIPQRPPSPPRPPPPPPEPEPPRRRRKLREYVSELGPGLQIELGMDDLFGEVLDSFVESVARDAVRLTAHRSGMRVEQRDVAYILKDQHNITLPGFAAQVPNRVHVPEDSNKRARLVAPRAARRRDEE